MKKQKAKPIGRDGWVSTLTLLNNIKERFQLTPSEVISIDNAVSLISNYLIGNDIPRFDDEGDKTDEQEAKKKVKISKNVVAGYV